MKKIETLEELATQIAKSNTFSKENYPILRKMSVEEQKVFAIKHLILHILKNTPNFIETWHLVSIGNFYLHSVEKHKNDHKTVMVKMLIDSVKLLEILGMSAEEIGKITQQYHRASTSYFSLLDHTQGIASQCENFDHEGRFNEEAVRESALGIMKLVLAGLNQEKSQTPCMQVPFQFDEAVKAVSEHIKK